MLVQATRNGTSVIITSLAATMHATLQQ
jgi:hypothetical protein